MSRIVDFFELAAAFDLAPAEALAFFRKKGLKPSFAWQDMLGEEHDAAFTVAKMMNADLLVTVKEKLDQAISTGSTLADFKKDLIPTLQAAGWWGKRDIYDPVTDKIVRAQLGSASRLETIFRTNIQNAYAAGHWKQIQENADIMPFLMYDAVDDDRTRPAHAALDGTVRPVKDKFWKTHFPPNGWNCRCGVIQMSQADLAEHGLKQTPRPKATLREWKNPRTGRVLKVPADLDPGWDNNPGIARKKRLRQIANEKGVSIPSKVPAQNPTPGTPAQSPALHTLDDFIGHGQSITAGLPDASADPQAFHRALLAKLDRDVGIGTSAAVASTGAGARLVQEASRRFPNTWTATADMVGPLYAKASRNTRGFHLTTDDPRRQGTRFRLPAFGVVRYEQGAGYISVRTGDVSNAVHEYAHRLQAALPQLDALFQQLHRRRTSGDPLRRLRDIEPHLNYRFDERTREDRYITPYQGKEYSHVPNGALEVMTIAMECVVGLTAEENRENFLKKLYREDREMLDFVVGVLFGWRP